MGAIKNIEKQRKNLQGIKFKCCSYDELNINIKGYVIYCDIPYKGTLKYTTDFEVLSAYTLLSDNKTLHKSL